MTDRAKRPLTLRDVSAASGVSEMTVSRVLRNRGDVSEATRIKVLEAAKTLGYVPNQIAGSLASQQVNLVAVIIPSLSNMVYPEVLNGINKGDIRCPCSFHSLVVSLKTVRIVEQFVVQQHSSL